MAKTVAILQSNYLPWKGYFDLIASADEFILYDDMQYTRRDWRNRNRIKTAQGVQWLTIPVESRGKFTQRIMDTRISGPGWAEMHWRAIRQNYAGSRYFGTYQRLLEDTYTTAHERAEGFLSRVNLQFLQVFCTELGIGTPLRWSTEYRGTGRKTERLVSLCRQAGATRYLSGPSAESYLEPALFAAAGIELAYMDYSGYPEYEQLFPPFEHRVSIIDLLLNTGPDARGYLKTASPKPVRP